MSRTAAILLAAGSGRRMQGAVRDKILAPLAGRPVFAHSAAAFAASGVADFYVVVYRDRRQMMELTDFTPAPAIFVKGGRERSDSVRLALGVLPPDVGHVFIHDCARPLVQPAQLRALNKIVRRTRAVVLAHRVTDTIKEQVRSRGATHLRNLDRSRLWAMETPQVFERHLACRAYESMHRRRLGATDDAAAIELLGHPVSVLENPNPNPKITTPADLQYLEFLLSL